MIIERKQYVSKEIVLNQFRTELKRLKKSEIDWITFIGSGETTLHAGLGELIRSVKELTDLPIAVITNGSLLFRPEVREELLLVDAVMPTLDSGNELFYRKINRPHPSLTYESFVNGLINFRKEFEGKLWIEVMLVSGMNDSREELSKIKKILDQINPDEIHILLPTRPPAEEWVLPSVHEKVMLAKQILGSKARMINQAEGIFDLGNGDSLVEKVIDIIKRHPMLEEDLVNTIKNYDKEFVKETIAKLKASGKVQIIKRFGNTYWSIQSAEYSDSNK
jgi:wyosine [tRNA(Phe)-imidazoG37] synthetase (radical SAM superfamily)